MNPPPVLLSSMTKSKTDKFSLALALHDLFYFTHTNNTAAIERLKKSKHLTAAGKVSKKGEEFLTRYFARGSDRDALMKELG